MANAVVSEMQQDEKGDCNILVKMLNDVTALPISEELNNIPVELFVIVSTIGFIPSPRVRKSEPDLKKYEINAEKVHDSVRYLDGDICNEPRIDLCQLQSKGNATTTRRTRGKEQRIRAKQNKLATLWDIDVMTFIVKQERC